MKRILCGVLVATSMSACVATATACETNYPEVEMKITFNSESYTLGYKLSRQVAPRTVKHFLALAENGYYDGLCVHNYEESLEKMYTGAYSYTDAESDEDGLVYKPYYETVQGYENFPVSVWMDKAKETPLYTLCGEFEENYFSVESGALRQTFGSLTMYYTEKNTTDRVCVEYLGEKAGELAYREYAYNSATSMFYISLSKSSTRNNEYCTFAELKESSVTTLENLKENIKEYIAENFENEETDETFTNKFTVNVNEDDGLVDSKSSEVYYVPSSPIVIEKVTVKKF